MTANPTLAEQFKEDALEAIYYIVQNKCVIEQRKNINDDEWETGTLREMLSFLISKGLHKKEKIHFYPWFMHSYRIKVKPTEQEIYNLTHVEK